MNAFLLPVEPVSSMDQYLGAPSDGSGLEPAREIGPAVTIEQIAASGLRSPVGSPRSGSDSAPTSSLGSNGSAGCRRPLFWRRDHRSGRDPIEFS